MINFVSHLPRDLRSGGFSAMNVAALTALGKHTEVNYVGPINPDVSGGRKLVSKVARTVGLAGDFFHYSDDRLHAISREVAAGSAPEAALDFFHGFTPWIRTAPSRPYVAWSDCTFHDYVDIYHRRAAFRAGDLDRIEALEAAWLARASGVAFTSRWAAERAATRYGLDPRKLSVVGIFGEVERPARDAYGGEKMFLFVSTNFEAKGGPIVLEAFGKVRARHPDSSLVIVGDRPKDLRDRPGVRVEGFLRKEHPAERRRFGAIMAAARAVVHPTRSDIAPLLLVEAGYHGCPAIASRAFAIPEIVQDRHAGVLLDDGFDSNAVAGAMNWMLEADEDYARMREAAWRHSRGALSLEQFEGKLWAGVEAALGEPGRRST